MLLALPTLRLGIHFLLDFDSLKVLGELIIPPRARSGSRCRSGPRALPEGPEDVINLIARGRGRFGTTGLPTLGRGSLALVLTGPSHAERVSALPA